MEKVVTTDMKMTCAGRAASLRAVRELTVGLVVHVRLHGAGGGGHGGPADRVDATLSRL